MPSKDNYATGRRKTATARVYLSSPDSPEQAGMIVVNNKPFEQFFPQAAKQRAVLRPLVVTDRLDRYFLKINVKGGGYSGQAGAVAHGIARVLEGIEPELRPDLKKAGLLTRDPRIVERKKPGRHKARKRPQFSKR